MARVETDPNYSSPTFSRATTGTDLFKKEDVQALAAAVSTHDHSTGKGLAVGGITDGSVTLAKLAANSVDSSKIVDGTIATADLANASVTNAKLASDTARDNLLTNGGMEIWQRGTGPFVGTGVYNADRWAQATSASDTLSVSRDSANADNSAFAVACTYVRSGGTGTTRLEQKFEDGAQLRGRTISLSVRVRTSTAGAVTVGLSDGIGASAVSTAHPGSGVYVTLSCSLSVSAAVTNILVDVFFANTSCTAYVDNAMLVVGSQAADYAPLHPADDLARCLRYYETLGTPSSSTNEMGSGQVYSTTNVAIPIKYVAKAVFPTVTQVGTLQLTNATGTPQNVTSFGTSGITQSGGALLLQVASGLVAGNASRLYGPSANVYVVMESNP